MSDELDIQQIPGIMRRQGWKHGAQLMERWFSLPANSRPENGQPDLGIVTMDWVLGFARAREVYDGILKGRIWVNPAAQREIVSMLQRNGWLGDSEICFGHLPHNYCPTADTMRRIEENYIQHRVVGGLTDPLDDLTAALGRFTFHIAVEGGTKPLSESEGHRVLIEKVGIYVRDSYDFNGDQDLGYWNPDDYSVARSWFEFQGGSKVSNSDFRAWRNRNGRGGDFLVFSDLRVLSVHDHFETIF